MLQIISVLRYNCITCGHLYIVCTCACACIQHLIAVVCAEISHWTLRQQATKKVDDGKLSAIAKKLIKLWNKLVPGVYVYEPTVTPSIPYTLYMYGGQHTGAW